MRTRLVLAIGSWRTRREGWEGAEQESPFWDRIVGWLMPRPCPDPECEFERGHLRDHPHGRRCGE